MGWLSKIGKELGGALLSGGATLGFGGLGGGSSIIGNVTGSDAASSAKEAAAIQAQSAADARAQLERLNKPYLNLGSESLPGFQSFLNPQNQYDYLQNNPLFQASVNNAADQLKASAAAQGKFGSGGLVNQLFQNYLSQGQDFVNNRYNQLLQPVQIGQNAASFQGTNAANLINQQGNAASAGIIGAQNAQSQGFNNLLGIGGTLASLLLG